MFEPLDIARIRFSIDGIEPPVWRVLLVHRKTTLGDLHHVLQAAFGWLDCHLHRFEIGGLTVGDPDILDEEAAADDPRTLHEDDIRLFDFAYDAPPFLYVYDFGDHWVHKVAIEAVLPAEAGRRYPICIDGARSRPPEDVGGTGGYEEFLDAFRDPDHPDHVGMRRWAGRGFDPERFDREKTDRAVRNAVRAARRRALAARAD